MRAALFLALMLSSGPAMAQEGVVPPELLSEIHDRNAEWRRCLDEAAVRYGKGSCQPAAALATAAFGKCKMPEDALVMAIRKTGHSNPEGWVARDRGDLMPSVQSKILDVQIERSCE
jgi:hypothetical protein